jgi:threonine aldolase
LGEEGMTITGPDHLKQSALIDLSFPYHGKMTAEARSRELSSRIETQRTRHGNLKDSEVVEALESYLCKLFGFDAAIWCPTGTLAQSIASRIYAGDAGTNKLGLHPTSHLLLHEEDGYKEAHGLSAATVGAWDRTLTTGDLIPDIACTFIELPQRHNGGQLPDWDEWLAIKKWHLENGVPLHVDGARIWGCRDHYGQRSFVEILDGASSLYVSLYKDIGAMGGAVLLGRSDFINEAKTWKARLGGLMIDPTLLVWDAFTRIDDKASRMSAYTRVAGMLSKNVAELTDWQINPSTPQTNMFHIWLPFSKAEAMRRRDETARACGVWLANGFWDQQSREHCILELVIGETALNMAEDLFVEALTHFRSA